MPIAPQENKKTARKNPEIAAAEEIGTIVLAYTVKPLIVPFSTGDANLNAFAWRGARV